MFFLALWKKIWKNPQTSIFVETEFRLGPLKPFSRKNYALHTKKMVASESQGYILDVFIFKIGQFFGIL